MIFRTASFAKLFGLTQLHSSVCLCITFLLFVPRPRSMYNPMLPPLSLVSVFAVYNVLMPTKMQWKPVVISVNSLLAAGAVRLVTFSSCNTHVLSMLQAGILSLTCLPAQGSTLKPVKSVLILKLPEVRSVCSS